VRNEELTLQILGLLRKGKTQKQISFKLRKHRNTIYRHVKRIREQKLYHVEEIVNKIDNKLTDELDEMIHRDLIAYRRILAPPQIDQTTTIEAGTKPFIIKKWCREDDEPTA